MYRFMLSLSTIVVSLLGVFSAVIQNPIGGEEDIKNNLLGFESDLIEGLTPPKIEAKNYFSSQLNESALNSEKSFVVEIYKNHIKMITTGLPAQKIKLNETEGEGIQKLSISFVELLNSLKLSSQLPENEKEIPDWKDVSPVITLSNSGVSLQFLRISESEPNVTEMSSEDRKILWDFLTKYARNIFVEKLKQLKLTEKYAEVLDSPVDAADSFTFQNFVSFLWRIIKISVNYAETGFKDWTTSRPVVTAPEGDKKIRSTSVTLFAYEEPFPFHEFPSQEFLYRRKDIDSIFYGRGII